MSSRVSSDDVCTRCTPNLRRVLSAVQLLPSTADKNVLDTEKIESNRTWHEITMPLPILQQLTGNRLHVARVVGWCLAAHYLCETPVVNHSWLHLASSCDLQDLVNLIILYIKASVSKACHAHI